MCNAVTDASKTTAALTHEYSLVYFSSRVELYMNWTTFYNVKFRGKTLAG